jgi:2-oxoglutarate dehydrogenase E2 component (dihydrolipoamide succinyltransferase)
MPPRRRPQKLMAENKGVSAEKVSGSGKRGQVLKGDVIDAIGKGDRCGPGSLRAESGARGRPARRR